MNRYKKALEDFNIYFNRIQKEYTIPGCSICVTKGSDVIISSGYGYKNNDTKEVMDADTQYFLASDTKNFVSLSAAILVDEGKLDWDRPIKEYIPWFKLYDEYATNRICLKDIFSHQSGMGSGYINLDTDESASVQEKRKNLLYKLRFIKPECDINTKHIYSSLMFAVPAYLIGEVSGMCWEDFLMERVLKPLNMKNTFFNRLKAVNTGNFSKYYYTDEDGDLSSYDDTFDGDPKKYNPFGASGCMTTTANDMRNYLIMLSNDGKFENKQIVSSKNLKRMYSSVFVENWDDPFDELGNGAAGLGWYIWSYRGHRIIEHGGYFGSWLVIIPSKNIGISVFPNFNNNDYPGTKAIVFNILDRMLCMNQIDWITRYKPIYDKTIKDNMKNAKKQDRQVKGTKPSHPLENYTGIYKNGAMGRVEVLFEDGKLFFKTKNEEKKVMEHYHYDTFMIHNKINNYKELIGFKTNLQGQIIQIACFSDKNILLKEN